jgi:hypothetical protein
MAERIMTLRELNRATLARQFLLPRERRRQPAAPSDDEIVAAVERIAGLQSQESRAAAIGLWTGCPACAANR